MAALSPSDRRRWWTLARVALLPLALAAAALVALRLAMRQLPQVVAQALGPRASVQAIELTWTGIELRELTLAGAPGRWPAQHELRAQRIHLRPALSSLWRPGWRFARVEVEGGYLALLRQRDGTLAVVPGLLGSKSAAPAKAAAAPPLRIDAITLDQVTLDLFDATLGRTPPHRLRLTDLRARLGPVALPTQDERIAIDLTAAMSGARHQGRLNLEGWLSVAARDADLTLQAHGVDLTSLQPYLLKTGEASVKAGRLDLDLRAKAANQRLHAPGRVVLSGLELSNEGGVFGTFGGVPRQAVLAALSRDGKIELDFTLEGRIDDPKFSLNELFAARFAVGLAEKLGVSLGGVVEGVGGVIKGLFGR